ncbi:hypothetical protein ALUC_81034S [Aspergillus luchuensis]|nr:hypothetical protein ALUC_81034S [Aspergillus luchuensis]
MVWKAYQMSIGSRSFMIYKPPQAFRPSAVSLKAAAAPKKPSYYGVLLAPLDRWCHQREVLHQETSASRSFSHHTIQWAIAMLPAQTGHWLDWLTSHGTPLNSTDALSFAFPALVTLP